MVDMTHTETPTTRKITAELPSDLLADMQEYTGQGITETLRRALEEMKQRRAYDRLMKLRGTYQFGLDLEELREDRDEPWLKANHKSAEK